MRPMIGIVPLYDETKESYWMLPGYMRAVEESGGVPVMLPLTESGEELELLAKRLDGFLFPGGHDVDPARYGEEMRETCGALCRERDAMECRLLPLVLERNKPVFGICRGLQIINAALGGTLYQDLPTEKPSPVNHHETPPYDKVAHEVALFSPLREILNRSSMGVNSYHHQGIRELAPSLQAAATAKDGVIEAAWAPEKRFLLAVQWHPEFSFVSDENSRELFRAFVKACFPTPSGPRG